jgi:ferric-dicitrate binding protein FerR (iron transport regulator)
MVENTDNIAALIDDYLNGTISDDLRQFVEDWKAENEEQFEGYCKVWESTLLISEMQSYDAIRALNKVTRRIKGARSVNWWSHIQKIAATLLIPVLLASLLYTQYLKSNTHQDEIVWQTIETLPGQKSNLKLPDGTSVWLNSETKLTYPVPFTRELREVKLSGEAFFDVTRVDNCPFMVDMGEINIKVLGTRFNVCNYHIDDRMEIILESGIIELNSDENEVKNAQLILSPGEKASYFKQEEKLTVHSVQADLYTAWIDGKLIFRDDPMNDVVKRLNQWFNVEIIITNPEISKYKFTATFQNESLEQVLELLKISSPILYKTSNREKDVNNLFSKKMVELYIPD